MRLAMRKFIHKRIEIYKGNIYCNDKSVSLLKRLFSVPVLHVWKYGTDKYKDGRICAKCEARQEYVNGRFSFPSKEQEEKSEYRLDLNLWESKKSLFGFIKYYEYRIFEKGKLRIEHTLFIKSPKTKKYIAEPPKQAILIPVGRKEFKEKYLSNKWMIPINRKLNMEIA